MANENLNSVGKGFLWSLWNLIPLAGPVIYGWKVLKVTLKSTGSRIAVILWLCLAPLVAMGESSSRLTIGLMIFWLGIFFFWYLIVKKIGWRFFWGTFILPGLFIVSVTFSLPLYRQYQERARQYPKERRLIKQQSYLVRQPTPKEMLSWTFSDKSVRKPGSC